MCKVGKKMYWKIDCKCLFIFVQVNDLMKPLTTLKRLKDDQYLLVPDQRLILENIFNKSHLANRYLQQKSNIAIFC